MRSATTLAVRPDFSVTAVSCRDDHTRWSAPEVHDDYRVVLVRRGRFRRRASGTAADLDATTAYVGVPGEEEHFAHPAGGDDCTSVSVTPALWRAMAGEATRPPAPTVYADAPLDLAHRRLLASARSGDVDYALAEELLGLLAATVARTVAAPARPPGGDAALVAAAREAITAAHPAADGLLPLAQLLDVSPYRLSRAFPRELGVSLTRYRNRVRVARALDRLEQGEPSLAALAADLGFADQSHLTRTLHHHLGRTPTSLRRLLTADRPPAPARP
ncbi:helix-turn-helix domain-containing protein [Streptomyces sp. NRRL F-5123]|uniref:helix-turn-helix domain-containing protein n=1 Tax=Streptomyces sp. NRRL F-5123 TaxID=1463856 RepID=UPI0004E215C6|nr:helix-turn-helix domain-containing protein [Streptomyces sp. NRRL F-5123]